MAKEEYERNNEEELTSEDIQNISYIGSEYINHLHLAEHTLEADIKGDRQTIHYDVYYGDGDDESFTIHTDNNDIYDRLSEPELRNLEEKLHDEVLVGRYIQRIEKAENAAELKEIEYSFMEDESFPTRLVGRFWETYSAKENDFSPTPDDDLTITPEAMDESAEQISGIDKDSQEESNSILTNEQIDEILRTGGGFENSRSRIYAKYQEHKSPAEISEFLKSEYRVTGKGFTFGNKSIAIWFDENGMKAGLGQSANDNTFLTMDWTEVESRIRNMILNGTYISRSEAWLADGAGYETEPRKG